MVKTKHNATEKYQENSLHDSGIFMSDHELHDIYEKNSEAFIAILHFESCLLYSMIRKRPLNNT